MLSGEAHVRRQPSGRRSHVEELALELHAPHVTALEHASDGVGELDLAQGSGLGFPKRAEDRRGEDVPAHHGEIAPCLGCRRLLDQPTHPVQLATGLGDLGTAVPRDLIVRHPHQGKDGRPQLLVGVPELAKHRGLGQGEVIGKHAQEGSIAHGGRGAEHGVAEAARPCLPRDGHPARVPSRASRRERGVLASLLEQPLEREIGAQMRGESLLALGKDQDDLIGPGGHGLLDGPLDHRAIENREQLFGKLLGGRKKACPQARGRDHAGARVHGGALAPVGTRPCSPLPLRDMPDTRTLLIEAVRGALDAIGVDPGFEVVVERSARPEFGDWSTPAALGLARALHRAPAAIAADLAAHLGAARVPRVRAWAVTPPGYINAHLDDRTWAQAVLASATDLESTGMVDLPKEAAAAAGKTLVEHTATNPNKAAHIGHLRNACIGDTVARVLRRTGHTVEVNNYIDDTGVQVADVVVGIRELGIEQMPDEPFDQYCSRVYIAISARYETDAALLERRRAVLREVEEGGNATAVFVKNLARRIVNAHLATMRRFDIAYDLLTWESDIIGLGFWRQAFELLR